MRSTQPGILPGNETKLVKMNTTRWTSTRNAVARCCQLLPAINAVLDERNEALRIPRTLAEQLVEIEQLLAPVAETTELLEARGRLMCEALSTMVACIRVVKSLQFRNQLVVEARNAFLTDLLLRLEKDDTLADLMFFALLDPRYRALPFSALLPVGIHEGHKCIWDAAAERARQRLQQEYAIAVQQGAVRRSNIPHSDVVPPSPPPPQARGSLVAAELSSISTQAPVVHELGPYLSEQPTSSAPLAWWKVNAARFPIIAVLARKYLAVPASTAEDERLFSDAKSQMTDRRNRMSSDLLESLLII